MIRLTKDVLAKVLKEHDGETKSTYYEGRNFVQQCVYKIKDGKMFVNRSGKTSWADSRFDDDEVCDLETTRRILHKYFLRG